MKIIRVKKCLCCPYRFSNLDGSRISTTGNKCMLKDRILSLDELKTIPTWCKLEEE